VEIFFLNQWIFGKVTSKNVIVSCTFSVFYHRVGQAHNVYETITFLLVTLCQIFTDLYFFSLTLSSKPFLIWLLTTPPHLKYVATLHYNLSLMACCADINVSQGSVATYSRCGGIFNMHLTANLPRNLQVQKFCKSVKIWQNYGQESVAPFVGPPCRSTQPCITPGALVEHQLRLG